MFLRVFAGLFALCMLYILLIFTFPNIADQYWNKEINTKIRDFKNQTLQFASGSDTPTSLFEKIKWTTTSYFDESKNTVKTIESTVNTKVSQAKDATVAVENAYSGVIDAANKIKILTGSGK